MSEPHPMTGKGCCYECGRQYGDEHGFPDLIIPLEQWRKISPTGDEGGLLCPSCICQALVKAGVRECPGAFMSGPIRSVPPDLMDTMRWVENLRLQLDRWPWREPAALPAPPEPGEGGEPTA